MREGKGLPTGAARGFDRRRDGGRFVVVERRVVRFVDHRARRDPAQEDRAGPALERDEAGAVGSNGTGHGSKIRPALPTC